jgi:hypothetical protein
MLLPAVLLPAVPLLLPSRQMQLAELGPAPAAAAAAAR